MRASNVLPGAAVAAGALLHDGLMFLTSGRPALALEILPASLVVVAIGALVGGLAGRFPRVTVLAALTVAALTVAAAHVAPPAIRLLRGVSAWTLAFAVAAAYERRASGRGVRAAPRVGFGSRDPRGDRADSHVRRARSPTFVDAARAAARTVVEGSAFTKTSLHSPP